MLFKIFIFLCVPKPELRNEMGCKYSFATNVAPLQGAENEMVYSVPKVDFGNENKG